MRGSPARPSKHAIAALLGLAGGIPFLYKPNAAIYLPAMLLWIGLYSAHSRAVLIRIGGVAVVAAVVPTLLQISRGLAPQESLATRIFALVDFNRGYVSQDLTIGGYALPLLKGAVAAHEDRAAVERRVPWGRSRQRCGM